MEDSKVSRSVTETFVDASVCEVAGAELVQAGSGRLVLVLVALSLRGGVESERPSDAGWC